MPSEARQNCEIFILIQLSEMHLARKIKKVEADFFKRMRTFLKTGFFSLEKNSFQKNTSDCMF